jgi:hypothetical protein
VNQVARIAEKALAVVGEIPCDLLSWLLTSCAIMKPPRDNDGEDPANTMGTQALAKFSLVRIVEGQAGQR